MNFWSVYGLWVKNVGERFLPADAYTNGCVRRRRPSGSSQSEEFCHSKKCEINSRHPSILRDEYPPAGWMSPEQRIFMIRARWKNWTSFSRGNSGSSGIGNNIGGRFGIGLFRSLLFSSQRKWFLLSPTLQRQIF